jgi:hypothetical protein
LEVRSPLVKALVVLVGAGTAGAALCL